jgi:cytochrome c oxidase subunit 1
MPMFIQGMAGVSRRLYDGGAQYAHAQGVLRWNEFMSISAWCLFLAQVPFLVNFFWSMKRGKAVEANPWQATTLEWAAAPSPPVAHGNFPHPPIVVRGPYEYSPPEAPGGFLPQGEPAKA